MLASSKTAFFVRWWHGGGQAAFPTRAWRKLIAFPLPNARSDLTFFLCTFGEWSQIIMKRLFKSLWRTSYMEGRKPWWWWWQKCNFESPLGQFRLSTTDCFLCSYPARSKQIDHLHNKKVPRFADTPAFFRLGKIWPLFSWKLHSSFMDPIWIHIYFLRSV